ncbi:phosphoesterase, partial [Streptomyces sp. NPDC005568]
MGVLGEWDRLLFTRVAGTRLPGADPAVTRLSRSADHGRLWLGAAAAAASPSSARCRTVMPRRPRRGR